MSREENKLALVLALIVYVVLYLSAVSTDYIVLSDDLSAPSTANMYKCQNKELISSLMVCDGYHDCHDNSDEMYCGKKF
jgi:hypothetical protein